MISHETVLVLGAGASMPYGFPSGPGLKYLILVEASAPGGWAESIRMASGFEYDQVRQFADELKYSGQQSVDAFLEHRPDLVRIGKFCMARCLIQLERLETLYPNKEAAWYELLFKRMNAKFEQFANNKITFITYNYDRSLEAFLVTSLRKTHNRSEAECQNIVKQLGIIHLHGAMGEYSNDPANGRQYSPHTNPESLKMAAEGIKIIHEGNEDAPEFVEARKRLLAAKRVGFLGFGYDPINLKRLRPGHWCMSAGITGSSFGLTDMERESIKDVFSRRIVMGEGGYDCTGTLRNVMALD